MVYQQNTQKRKIGIVILGSTDTDVVLTYMRQIIVAIQSITRSPKAVPVPMSRPRRTKRSTSRH